MDDNSGESMEPMDEVQGRNYRIIFGGVGGIGGGRGQWLGGTMASAKHARAYNWGLGAEPPAGPSRGRASGQGVRGRSPAEAENILVIGCPTEPANLASLD